MCKYDKTLGLSLFEVHKYFQRINPVAEYSLIRSVLEAKSSLHSVSHQATLIDFFSAVCRQEEKLITK